MDCILLFIVGRNIITCNLDRSSWWIQLVEPPGGVPYIEYTENVSNNRPGGLKHRKIEAKKVKHHAKYQRPDVLFGCLKHTVYTTCQK